MENEKRKKEKKREAEKNIFVYRSKEKRNTCAGYWASDCGQSGHCAEKEVELGQETSQVIQHSAPLTQ